MGKTEYFNDMMARLEELFYHELSDCACWKTEFIGVDFIQSKDIQGKTPSEITPGIFAGSRFRNGYNYRPGFAQQGEFSGYFKGRRVNRFHGTAFEGYGRVCFDVKKIRTSEMFVPLFDMGGDRLCVDLHFNRILAGPAFIEPNATRRFIKRAEHIGDVEVFYPKDNRRMVRIETIKFSCLRIRTGGKHQGSRDECQNTVRASH